MAPNKYRNNRNNSMHQCCTGRGPKVKFVTKKQAEDTMASYNKKPKRAYFCKVCGYWHLTSSNVKICDMCGRNKPDVKIINENPQSTNFITQLCDECKVIYE